MSNLTPAAARHLDRLLAGPQPPASPPEPEGRPSVGDVLAAIAEMMDVEPAALQSARRAADLALGRHVVMHIAVRRLHYSLPAVGRLLQRDHTTVLHGARRVDDLLHDDRMRYLVEAVSARAASKFAERTEPYRRLLPAGEVLAGLRTKAPPVMVVDGKRGWGRRAGVIAADVVQVLRVRRIRASQRGSSAG